MGSSKSKNKKQAKQIDQKAQDISAMVDHKIPLDVLAQKYSTNFEKGLTHEQAEQRKVNHDYSFLTSVEDHYKYPQKTVVFRSGEQVLIYTADLVLGDLVVIDRNTAIPADLRVIQCKDLKIDNQNLTGEMQSQLRTVECTHPNEPFQTRNLVFFGTTCIEGSGKGVVIALGSKTVYGQIVPVANKK